MIREFDLIWWLLTDIVGREIDLFSWGNIVILVVVESVCVCVSAPTHVLVSIHIYFAFTNQAESFINKNNGNLSFDLTLLSLLFKSHETPLTRKRKMTNFFM